MSFVRTLSLAALACVAASLLPAPAFALAGCESYITITQLPPNPTNQATGNFRVEYGNVATTPPCLEGEIDPATFRFTINGVDRTNYFTTYAGYAIASNVPLVDKTTNTFRATVTGFSASGAPRTDADQKSVYVDTTPLSMSVSIAINNGDNQNSALCAASCFAATYTHSTPAYYTLDTPRSISLSYNSDRAFPRPFIYADVFATNVQEYWLEASVKWASDFVPVTFLNGETRLRFAGASQQVRLAGQFDASSQATKAAPLRITVTAAYYGGTTESITLETRVIVVNEANSAVAPGWTIVGAPRLFLQSDGALLVDGSASAVFFQSCGSGCFSSPQGEYRRLLAGAGSTYTLVAPDSSKVQFNAIGLSTILADRFGNITELYWFQGSGLPSPRLGYVYDPVLVDRSTGLPEPTGFYLSYNATGLEYIIDPTPDGSGAYGRRTTFSRSMITDPDGGMTRFTYDGFGRLSTITDRRYGETRYGYSDSSWKLVSIALPAVALDAGGGAESGPTPPTILLRPWQSFGVPTTPTASIPATPASPDSVAGQLTDPVGRRTTFTVDRWGQPLRVTDALAKVTTITRAGVFPVRVAYPNGQRDTLAFDGPNLVFSQAAGGNAERYRYGAYSQVDSVWGNASEPSQRLFIGTNGQIDSVRVSGQDTVVTRYRYAPRGLVDNVTDPAGHQTFIYTDTVFKNTIYQGSQGRYITKRLDGFGRDSIVQHHDDSFQYDDSPTHMTYDVMNRVGRVISGWTMTDTIMYSYDGLFLTEVRDPKGQSFRIDHNALGWVTRRYDVNQSSFLRFRYDAVGRRTSVTNRRGGVIDYRFDLLDRLMSKTGLGVAADSFFYVDSSRLAVAVGNNGSFRDSSFFSTTGWTDSVVTRMAGNRFRLHYSQSSADKRHLTAVNVSSTTPVAFASRRYAYNVRSGAVDTMYVNNQPFVFGNGRDGNRSRINLFGGLAETRGFSARHRIPDVSYTNATVNDALYRAYDFGPMGRLSRILRIKNTSTYQISEFDYDPVGRLDSVSLFDSSSAGKIPLSRTKFAYDQAGNLFRETVNGTVVLDAQYDPGNRLLSMSGRAYLNDADGNIVSRSRDPGSSVQHYWSADGRLDSTTIGAYAVRYRYNAHGQLVERESSDLGSRYYLWDGDQLLAELESANGGLKRRSEYVYTLEGIDRPLAVITGASGPGSMKNLLQDVVGNVIGVALGNSVVQHLSYSAFGASTNLSNQFGDTLALRWKGLLWDGDSTQLYYVRKRWYAPALRRFVSEDPLGVTAGLNAYAFAGNDPVNRFDPSGLDDYDERLREWWDCLEYFRNDGFSITDASGACGAVPLPRITIFADDPYALPPDLLELRQQQEKMREMQQYGRNSGGGTDRRPARPRSTTERLLDSPRGCTLDYVVNSALTSAIEGAVQVGGTAAVVGAIAGAGTLGIATFGVGGVAGAALGGLSAGAVGGVSGFFGGALWGTGFAVVKGGCLQEWF